MPLSKQKAAAGVPTMFASAAPSSVVTKPRRSRSAVPKKSTNANNNGRSRSAVPNKTTNTNQGVVTTTTTTTVNGVTTTTTTTTRGRAPAATTTYASKPKSSYSPKPSGHQQWKKPAPASGVPTMFAPAAKGNNSIAPATKTTLAKTPSRRSLSPNHRSAKPTTPIVSPGTQATKPTVRRKSLSPKRDNNNNNNVPTMFRKGPPTNNHTRSHFAKPHQQQQQQQVPPLVTRAPVRSPVRARAKSPLPASSSSSAPHHVVDQAAAKRAQDKIAAMKKKAAAELPSLFAPKQKLGSKAPLRLQKWKDQQQRRRSSIAAKPNNIHRILGPPPVERVPKLSALLAMGGTEAEEEKKRIALEKLAKWKDSAQGRWQIKQQTWDGLSQSEITKDEVRNDLDMDTALKMFHENPEKYVALHFQPTQKDPIDYTFVLREGTVGYRAKGVRDDQEGALVLCRHLYKRLEPFPNDILPMEARDQYTDHMTFARRKLHSNTNKPILPGRGMGLGDEANMELMGDFPQPAHVRQGANVGDCWLLSAIACLADFHWAIERLFRKTIDPDVHQAPLDAANTYTVTLWDLKTWKEVDIVIDERLPVRSDGSGFLLGARPSKDGKFWVPYLEKAVAVHCGGYDKICGGQCTDAWPMLTGSRNQFVISKNPKTKKYWCGGKYNPKTEKWSDLTNSPRDSARTLWHVDWPLVGGGGDKDLELTQAELFGRLIAWDEYNFLLGAATSGTSDRNTTDGIVDNHAYSIIDSRQDICGTGIDLLLIRNPWGEGGELKNGLFMRSGQGWNKYPNIKQELNPSMEDNGLCWVTKEEFFNYFPTIFVGGMNIARLKDSDYINDLEDHFERGANTEKAAPTQKADKPKPGQLDTSSDPSSPYKVVVTHFNAGISYDELNKKLVKGKQIQEGINEFRANPEKYLAIHYQSNVVPDGWPVDKHSYTLVLRQGTNDMEPTGVVAKNGKKVMLTNVLR